MDSTKCSKAAGAMAPSPLRPRYQHWTWQVASALLEALFETGSEHPAYEKMQPYDTKPAALVLAASGGEST